LIAVLCAVVVSSIVFASAHHWAGETYSAYAFGYRTIAGGIFAALYLTRGFAVAVWTHSSYDFYVAGL
jgi:membrane protease YdiL (CAAX protease family)